MLRIRSNINSNDMMATNYRMVSLFLYYFFIVACALMVFSSAFSSLTLPESKGIKGGYWPSWLAEQNPPSKIRTKYFTHLFYAFVSLDASTYNLSLTQFDDQWMSNFTASLHAQNPPAKAFLSIGGGLSSPYTFSNMTNTTQTRSTFTTSTIQTARKYGFDGLDPDWEFPNNEQDMSNLALLFKQWRKAIEIESISYNKPKLILSAAVYFAPDFFLIRCSKNLPWCCY
ncbi:hypothetical protein Q3G72_012441 [Acer saccharum]|nr:hypothetical protein Q3G72_012441 [Acer saccharum]